MAAAPKDFGAAVYLAKTLKTAGGSLPTPKLQSPAIRQVESDGLSPV